MYPEDTHDRISHLPIELAGSTLFQTFNFSSKQYVKGSKHIEISSDIQAQVFVALSSSYDGGLTHVLPRLKWNLQKGWIVKSHFDLDRVYLKTVSAGNTLTFTTTKDPMTIAIFVLEGTTLFVAHS